MNTKSIKRGIRHLIPTGSPLWCSYFYTKKLFSKINKSQTTMNFPFYFLHSNILLKKYKAIYFYIPKVACSSMKKVCADILDISVDGEEISEDIHFLDFPFARRYEIHSKYHDYFKFSFVRNPWDRIVSCYKDKVNYGQTHVYAKYDNKFTTYLQKKGVYKDNMSFEEYIEIICQISDEEAEGHFLSQHKYIMNDSGKIIVDYIGRFERLSEDYNYVRQKLGFEIYIPHLRQGSRNSYREYYTDKTIELVRTRYKDDIEMFEYNF